VTKDKMNILTIYKIYVLINYLYKKTKKKMKEILDIFWMNPIGQTFGLLGMMTVI
jgi:hypothetical protein